MIVLDASAIIALLGGEPAMSQVSTLLAENDAALTVAGISEVVDFFVRSRGVRPVEIALDIEQLGLAPPLPVTAPTGLAAGLLRARTYHRTLRPISLIDCIVVECARAIGAPVASSDHTLLDVCAEEGIAVVPLFSSSGVAWQGRAG